MNVSIKIIPNALHRPGITGADWFFKEDGDLQVMISEMSNWRYEMCLALHEMFEAILCKHAGVTHEQVDAYDIPYEATHSVKCNAGDEPDCPYRRQHCFATAAERILAGELGVEWIAYESELEKF